MKVKAIANGNKDNTEIVTKLYNLAHRVQFDLNYSETNPKVENPTYYERKGIHNELEGLVVESFEKGYRDFIFIGGDGTVHDAIKGIMKAGENITASLIPTGTCNDFSKMALGNRSQDEAFLSIERYYKGNNNKKNIDVYGAEANGHFISHWINEFSPTGSGQVHSFLVDNKYFKNVFGKLAFPLLALYYFPKFKKPDVEIIADGKKIFSNNNYTLMALNTKSTNDMLICPDAKIDDGKLDLFSLEDVKFFPFYNLTKCMLGKSVKDNRGVRNLQASEIEMIATKNDFGKDMEIDGETYSMIEPIKKVKLFKSGSIEFIVK